MDFDATSDRQHPLHATFVQLALAQEACAAAIAIGDWPRVGELLAVCRYHRTFIDVIGRPRRLSDF